MDKKIKHILNYIPMGRILLFDALLRHVDNIVENEDAIIAKEEKDKAEGKISWVNPVALVRDAKAIKVYLEKE
jgi:hypothetical protein